MVGRAREYWTNVQESEAYLDLQEAINSGNKSGVSQSVRKIEIDAIDYAKGILSEMPEPGIKKPWPGIKSPRRIVGEKRKVAKRLRCLAEAFQDSCSQEFIRAMINQAPGPVYNHSHGLQQARHYFNEEERRTA
jgi:hypothetical protein